VYVCNIFATYLCSYFGVYFFCVKSWNTFHFIGVHYLFSYVISSKTGFTNFVENVATSTYTGHANYKLVILHYLYSNSSLVFNIHYHLVAWDREYL